MHYCFWMTEIYNTKALLPPPISSLLKINFPTLWKWHSHGWELMHYNYMLLWHLDEIVWLTHHYNSHLIYGTADTFFMNTTEDPKQTGIYGLSIHPEFWKEINDKDKIFQIGFYQTNKYETWFAEKNCPSGKKIIYLYTKKIHIRRLFSQVFVNLRQVLLNNKETVEGESWKKVMSSTK